MLDVAFSRRMCCSRVCSASRYAGRPTASTETPTSRPGMRALEALPHAHVAGVRATEAHRHAEALGGADGDVGAPLPRRRRQGQREQVGGCRDERPGVVGGGGERGQVVQRAVHRGVLHEHAEHLGAAGGRAQLVGGRDAGEVGDDDRDAAAGTARVCTTPRVCGKTSASTRSTASAGGLARAAHQGHRLGRGGRLVEQGRAGDRQAGEVADDGLEVEQRLEPALGDLRLVGRVGGVPGGVLEHVALDHGRGEGAVVAEPDHRGDPPVAGGDLAQLLEHGGLGGGRLDVEGLGPADAAGHGGVDQVGERAAADDLEHRGDVVLARADVAGRERGQVGGAGCSRWLLEGRRRRRLPLCHVPARWPGAPEVPVPCGPLRLRGSGEVCPFGAPTSCVEVSPTRCERRAPIYHRRTRAVAAAQASRAARRAPSSSPGCGVGVDLVLGPLAGQVTRARPRPRATPCRARCRRRPDRPAAGR